MLVFLQSRHLAGNGLVLGAVELGQRLGVRLPPQLGGQELWGEFGQWGRTTNEYIEAFYNHFGAGLRYEGLQPGSPAVPQ